MNDNLYPRSGRGSTILLIVGWLLIVALGLGLLWFGFGLGNGESADATPTTSEAAAPTAAIELPVVTPFPSSTPPLPTATPLPSPAPVTDTPVVASAVVGESGVNVRTGPGTQYTRIGYLDPGSQVELTGQYGDWWQIRYQDSSAWVFGELVTASNTQVVPQVQPPAAPTAAPVQATAAPTAVPPTESPPTPSTVRGLVAEGFQVEGAPGPYGSSSDIWFNMWVYNSSSNSVEYDALGVFVEETNEMQKSWSYSQFQPGQRFVHRDHINQFTLGAGTYHLWLMICFSDGCVRLSGPVQVVVQ